jgi:hypothetical protein
MHIRVHIWIFGYIWATLVHSQVANSTLPMHHCQIVKCTLPCGLPQWDFSCQQIKTLSGMPNAWIFSDLPKLLPKTQTAPDFSFFTGCLGSPHPPPFLSLPPSLPPSFKFLLDGSLELERSPFKIETFFSIFSTYWEQIAKFWVQNSYFFSYLFQCMICDEVTLMECKSIHGNSWNLWMKWSSSNAMYGFVFYPCRSMFDSWPSIMSLTSLYHTPLNPKHKKKKKKTRFFLRKV